MSTFLLIAKAGGSGEAAENTCEAIRRCVGLRLPDGVALGLELDLRLSRDGQLVALHDARLERTTNGRGLVRDLDRHELRGLTAGPSGERVPTLAEVLEAAGEHPVLLDLHDDDMAAASAVCRELARFRGARREQIWVASEHGRVIEALRRLDPTLHTAATKREAWRKLLFGRPGLTRFVPSGHLWVVPERHAGLQVVTPRFIEQARAAGDDVWAFVVDEAAAAARLRAWGAGGCITTRPEGLAAAFASA